MRKSLKIMVVAISLVTLLAMQFTFASPGKGNGNQNSFKLHKDTIKGYEKMLKNYKKIDGAKIKINNRFINFDVPPVIKSGRTLIPVRAVTEGLGAKVEWDGALSLVTITSPDGLIKIELFLNSGDVWVIEDGVRTNVTLDVAPALHNNRTFVPLRFIAETFGLKVAYDDKTGEIDIDDSVKLDPKSISFETLEAVVSKDINVSLNGYTFNGITGLTAGSDKDYVYTPHATDLNKAVLTINKSYMVALTAEKTTLAVTFTKGTKTVTKEITIKLEYNDTDHQTPSIKPVEVVYSGGDVVITLLPDAKNFEDIWYKTGYLNDDHYTVANNTVTFKAAFIATLLDGTHDFYFIFETDEGKVTPKFSLQKTTSAQISPIEVSYASKDLIIAPTPISLVLNGHTFEGITGLIKDTDYTYDGQNLVTLLPETLKTFTAENTALVFTFKKDGQVKQVTYTVKLAYNKPVPLAATITPLTFTYADSDVVITMTPNDYTFDRLRFEPYLLDTTSHYAITGNVLTLKKTYLDTFSVGTHSFDVYFKSGLKEIKLTFALTVD